MEASGSTNEHAAAGPATETHHSALPEATSRDQKLLFSGRCRTITLRSRLIRVVTKYYSPMLYLARAPTTAVRRFCPIGALTGYGGNATHSGRHSPPHRAPERGDTPRLRLGSDVFLAGWGPQDTSQPLTVCGLSLHRFIMKLRQVAPRISTVTKRLRVANIMKYE